LHLQGKLETLLFPAAVSTFWLITYMQVKWLKKIQPNSCQLLMQPFSPSEKESEVALRLSSTSGCQAAGKPNARGWPGGDVNSDSQPKALGSQGRLENQVQEQEQRFHCGIPEKGQRA